MNDASLDLMAHSVIRRAAIFLVAIGGIADIGRVLARDGLSAFDPKRTTVDFGPRWFSRE